MDLNHNKRDGEGKIDYSTTHNGQPHTDTDKKITRIWVQYIFCRDEDTGDTWTEGYRAFPAQDSFLQKAQPKKKKESNKPKVGKKKSKKKKKEESEVEEL